MHWLLSTKFTMKAYDYIWPAESKPIKCYNKVIYGGIWLTLQCCSLAVYVATSFHFIYIGLETIECSFVDSSGCQHFYFVARGQQIEAEKSQSNAYYVVQTQK